MTKDEFVFEDEEGLETDQKDDPRYGSPEWEPYIISKFLPDELYNEKHPTLNGLRRVSLEYFSGVIKSAPVIVNSNLPVSSMCVYEIQFDNGMTFGAAADATQENINGNYNIYPTALAESRAEARVYRKALMITAASADEIKGNEKASFDSVLETVKEYSQEDPISEQQKSIIETKSKQLKIDYKKFLILEKVNLETATKADGVALAKKLTEFQKTGNIPKELK